MWPFNKQGVSDAEIIDRKETSLEKVETIEVRDIRQYLVDEYERTKALEAKCDGLRLRLEQAEETRHKYNATLVTLDDLSGRVDRRDKRIAELEEKIEDEREKVKQALDEVNKEKINVNRMQPDEVAKRTRKECADALRAAIGNLSKARAARIVMGEEDV